MADDLGKDKLSTYGISIAPPTPALDQLASRGLLFRNFWSHPSCSPTRAAFLTGEYVHRNLIGRAISPSSSFGLDPTRPYLLPKLLPPSYAKVAVGKWHVGAPGAGGWHPIAAGFDLYAGALMNLHATESYGSYTKTYASPAGVATVGSTSYITDDETEDALSALSFLAALGRPWLLQVCFHAIHEPLHFPPGMGGTPTITGMAESRAMARYLDRSIGRILAAVDWRTTTVIFFSDNGTSTGLTQSNLRGAKGTLYEGGVSVPLILAGQAVSWQGASDELVQDCDLFATALAIAWGFPGPLQLADAHSLVPVLLGGRGTRRHCYSEEFRPNGQAPPATFAETARDARWKLISGSSGSTEFFDLLLDPSETTPLALSGLTPPQLAAYNILQGILSSHGF
ncbi:MAG: sulfatase-like hydrolase/transferase [Planctomycetes bacterium]|nr:sulfatase-like hydrolase/transferase [Planctomycetota bacterium]